MALAARLREAGWGRRGAGRGGCGLRLRGGAAGGPARLGWGSWGKPEGLLYLLCFAPF